MSLGELEFRSIWMPLHVMPLNELDLMEFG
jgi:hypothetical protein